MDTPTNVPTKLQENSVSNQAADSVMAIENDREFKAYIYQQLLDLQPLLEPDSQISVLVQVEPEVDSDLDLSVDDDSNALADVGAPISLSLVATIGEYQIEAEGRDQDMYEAFSMAKQAMFHQLDEFASAAIDTNEREAEIRSLLSGAATIH